MFRLSLAQAVPPLREHCIDDVCLFRVSTWNRWCPVPPPVVVVILITQVFVWFLCRMIITFYFATNMPLVGRPQRYLVPCENAPLDLASVAEPCLTQESVCMPWWSPFSPISLFTYLSLARTCDIPMIFSGVEFITILKYFDPQIIPDLTKGEPLQSDSCVLVMGPPTYLKHFLAFWHNNVPGLSSS